jgi:hypothetical protein
MSPALLPKHVAAVVKYQRDPLLNIKALAMFRGMQSGDDNAIWLMQVELLLSYMLLSFTFRKHTIQFFPLCFFTLDMCYCCIKF